MKGHLLRRPLIPLVLAAVMAGCASTPSSGDRLELARQAYQANDYERAFALTRAEAELGNARAQYALGYMYYNGEGTAADPEVGLKWIRKAAEQADPKAVEALGRLAKRASQPATPPAAADAPANPPAPVPAPAPAEK